MRTILKKGIDVSKHQGTIDWVKVKKAGIDFAMIRCGYRGSSTGKQVEDVYFQKNIQGALDNGIEVGIYFFSTAKNEYEAREDAYFTINRIKKYKVTYPVVFDFEGYNEPSYRTYGISKAQRTANCLAFQQIVKAQGYKCMLYGSKGNIRTTYDLDVLTDYLWIAKYSGGYTKILDADKYFPDMGSYAPRVAMWQYTSIGRVDGIKGNVDLDYQYIDLPESAEIAVTCPYKEPTSTVKYNALTKRIALESVKWVQYMLNKYGYGLEIDGKFGCHTLAAVKDFQSKHKLDVDGKVGPATKAALKK